MTIALGLLAAAGLVIASYFTAIAYRWMSPQAAWVPSVCRLDDRTCASVVFTPSARVFGPPNSLLGQLYYLALLVGLATGAATEPGLRWLFVTASVATVGLGLYLSYALLFVLRVPCPLCFTTHAINLTICVGLLAAPA